MLKSLCISAIFSTPLNAKKAALLAPKRICDYLIQEAIEREAFLWIQVFFEYLISGVYTIKGKPPSKIEAKIFSLIEFGRKQHAWFKGYASHSWLKKEAFFAILNGLFQRTFHWQEEVTVDLSHVSVPAHLDPEGSTINALVSLSKGRSPGVTAFDYLIQQGDSGKISWKSVLSAPFKVLCAIPDLHNKLLQRYLCELLSPNPTPVQWLSSHPIQVVYIDFAYVSVQRAKSIILSNSKVLQGLGFLLTEHRISEYYDLFRASSNACIFELNIQVEESKEMLKFLLSEEKGGFASCVALLPNLKSLVYDFSCPKNMLGASILKHPVAMLCQSLQSVQIKTSSTVDLRRVDLCSRGIQAVFDKHMNTLSQVFLTGAIVPETQSVKVEQLKPPERHFGIFLCQNLTILSLQGPCGSNVIDQKFSFLLNAVSSLIKLEAFHLCQSGQYTEEMLLMLKNALSLSWPLLSQFYLESCNSTVSFGQESLLVGQGTDGRSLVWDIFKIQLLESRENLSIEINCSEIVEWLQEARSGVNILIN